MKRSEKIEVRLSHEEKQSLSAIADGEGRTVSDLVRGLIERYVNLNASPLPRKPHWALWAGLVASGLLIGHLGTWGMMQLHHRAGKSKAENMMSFGLYKLSVLLTQTTSNEKLITQILEVPLLVKNGSTEVHIIEREGNDVRMTTNVVLSDDTLPTVKFDACEITDGKCLPLASPKLTIAPEETASITLMTDRNYMMGLVVEPSSTEVTLKSYTRTREAIKNTAPYQEP